MKIKVCDLCGKELGNDITDKYYVVKKKWFARCEDGYTQVSSPKLDICITCMRAIIKSATKEDDSVC